MRPLCIVSAPPDTYSGYGARSRDFIKALYQAKKDEWEIKVLPQRWGNTAWGFIDANKEEWGWMKEIFFQSENRQPDVWIQITVPNEFQAVGKVNIGVTAGIETTICDPSWMEGVNRMNVTFVSSNHAKQVFEQSAFEERDQQTQQVRRVIRLEKPVEVLFEGVNLDKYFHIEEKELPQIDLVKDLNDIKESFAYLYVGHWLQGDLGEDRKNTNLLVKLFLETFKGKKNRPALILKTSAVSTCIIDRDEMLKKIDIIRGMVDGKDLPNIYLLHGDLEDEDMNILYNHPKVKAMITLTKGEGFGRPLAEFALSKKPIIATAWSGHTDFLSPEFSILLPGELRKIHHSAVVQNMLIPESSWFAPDEKAAVKSMQEVFENYSKFEVGGKRQGHKIKTEFSFEAMAGLLGSYLVKYVPKQEPVKLPQLKKIQLPTLKK